MVALTGIERANFQFSPVQLSSSSSVFSLVRTPRGYRNAPRTSDVVTRESLLGCLGAGPEVPNVKSRDWLVRGGKGISRQLAASPKQVGSAYRIIGTRAWDGFEFVSKILATVAEKPHPLFAKRKGCARAGGVMCQRQQA
jgi:hypothetical protein